MKRVLLLLLSLLLLLLHVGCVKEPDATAAPYVKDGYWYIDGVNTNVKAEGVDGADGLNGIDGKDGKDVTVYEVYNVDKVHPSSDTAGRANEIYAGLIAAFLRTVR